MSFKFILFDLDDTLYPPTCGLLSEVGHRIQLWLVERLALSWDDATALRRDYFGRFGTTLGGLLAERQGVDADEFLEFVHDVPVEAYLEPEPELAAMLSALPLRRVIYTNATTAHARRVLRALDVAHCFERIIGIAQVGLCSKSFHDAYERALALLDAQGPECIMVEDSARNLRPAKALGLTTVLVREDDPSHVSALPVPRSQNLDGCVDFLVTDVLQVERVVQSLVDPV